MEEKTSYSNPKITAGQLRGKTKMEQTMTAENRTAQVKCPNCNSMALLIKTPIELLTICQNCGFKMANVREIKGGVQ